MLKLWHARFGHADRRVTKHMADKQLGRGLDLNRKVALPDCEACVKATMTNGPMNSKTVVTRVPRMIIHTVVAEMNVKSREYVSGNRASFI